MILRMYSILLILFCLLLSCDFPFPESEKIDIPTDHTVKQGNAMHKEGLDHPLGSGSCSTSSCHKSDLKGGLVQLETNSKWVVTPSCFQCHGKEWD